MESTWEDLATRVCNECGGRCCAEAQPPLTRQRIDLIHSHGVNADSIDTDRYKKFRMNSDGYCMMFRQNRCTIHGIKPETCVAGPFTFDIRDNHLEIYLKKESICPLVHHLRARPDIYEKQYALALASIILLLRHLPRDEISEILKIDEPETEKVAEIPIKGLIGDDGWN